MSNKKILFRNYFFINFGAFFWFLIIKRISNLTIQKLIKIKLILNRRNIAEFITLNCIQNILNWAKSIFCISIEQVVLYFLQLALFLPFFIELNLLIFIISNAKSPFFTHKITLIVRIWAYFVNLRVLVCIIFGFFFIFLLKFFFLLLRNFI